MDINLANNLNINEETLPLIKNFGEMMPGGFFVYHAYEAQELIYFNHQMVLLFGCENDDEFRALVKNSFKGIVHPDEYEFVEKNIRQQITSGTDNMDHVKYRFIRKDGSVGMMDDYGHFSISESFGEIYYVFVQDISKEYDESIEKKRIEAQERENIISRLSGSESTYIGYPETDKFIILNQSDYLKERYTSDESFTESIKRYIESDVYGPDKKKASEEIVLRKIEKYLEDEDEYSFLYRDVSSGIPCWYKLRAMRLSDEEILYGFTNVEDDLCGQILYEGLKENYFGLYYANLDSGFVKVIRTDHPEITGEIGTAGHYADLIRKIAAASKDESAGFLEKISNIDYIKKRFKSDDTAYFSYKSHIYEHDRWVIVTGRVLSRNEDGSPELFGIGFSLMDKESSEREKTKFNAVKNELEKVIDSIAESYDTVLLVDMESDDVIIRKVAPDMQQNLCDFDSFTKVREFFLSSVFHPADRDKMAKELSFDTIKEKTAKTPSYNVEYNMIKDNKTLRCEMRIMGAAENNVIIGMAERDIEICKRHLEEKRFDEYMALYSVDADTGTIRAIKTNELYSTISEGNTGPYRDAMLKYSTLYSGETKDFFEEISDVKNVNELFKSSDKFTYTFKSVELENDFWIEAVSYCLTRNEDGSPACFTLGFTAADELTAMARESQIRMKVDMQMISGLAGEYYALYYYNIADGIFNIYTLDEQRFPQAAGMVAAGGEPIEILRRFGTSALVHPDDRAAFAHMDIEYIMRKLANSKKHTIRFRRLFNGEYLWTEMDFIKYEDYAEPANAIAIGFAERDTAIRSQQALNSAYEIISKDCGPDDAINELLSVAGEFYDAERCYIFENKNNRKFIDNTYEWCADGVEPMIDILHDVPYEVCDGWYGEFRRQGAFFMDALDSEHNTPETVEILKMQGIESLIAAPLLAGDEIIGYIGVDDPKKARNDVFILQRIANVAYSEILKRNEFMGQNAFNSFFLDPYLSAYYVGLGDLSCKVFKRTGFLEGKYPLLSDYLSNISKYIDECVHKEDRENLNATIQPDAIRAELKNHEQYSVTYRDISGDKERFYRMQVIRGADVNHAVLGFMDITDEMAKQREEEAARDIVDQQRHIKAFGNMVNAALWSINIGRDNAIKGVYWSDEFRRMFGYEESEEAFPNKLESWTNIIHPDDKQSVMEDFYGGIQSTDTAGYVYDVQYRILRKNGEYCWYRATGRMEDTGNGDRRLYGILVDISADKQLEEALSMAESANRAKTTFLNNMSHDIRTPMNAIIGYTGLAASHIDNKAQVQDYLSKIAQSSDHLLSLINDVLDMSRIESGKMNIDEKEEDLSEIIHTLRDIVQSDIHAKQQDFFIDTVNVNDESIICDKLRLNQALLNILSNSIKYTPSGGTISMRITETSVKPNGYATYEFRIKDNGMGMDKEYLKTIFDPFTRVKSSTVSGIQGTGLGMAITKNIIDMMNGTIDIESELGKGTETVVTFDFKLQKSHKEPAVIKELKGLRGLVVDDDTNACLSVSGMLRDIGMRYEWCTTGKEAVIRAEEAYRTGDRFKVYIIDWLMPDMNGIETVRRIRKVIGDDTPIIILTSYDWADIEDEAREAGVTAFVNKPLFPSDLNRTLRQLLDIEESKTEIKSCEYSFAGKKILLVEDNELNREIATEILAEDGFVVDAVEDGTEAVEKMKAAKADDYDLILMDIQMPIMNGYEATRIIRSMDTEVSEIPIIAMTANAFEEDRQAALKAGMNEHISKPIDIERLKSTLARFL